MFQAMTCPNCGAAVSTSDMQHDLATCAYCRASFRVPKTLTPEPDMGDLILGADFSAGTVPGWGRFHTDKTELKPGTPPELRAEFPSSNLMHYVLQSSGLFDDYDASVSIRFLQGNTRYIRAGFALRYDPNQGGYALLISAQSTYMIGWYHQGDDGKLAWAGELIDWTEHTALREGLNASNRLRVVMYGERMRVYLNGVLASSLRDEKFRLGQVRLGLEPSDKSSIAVAFSDLQLREVPAQLEN